jgi:hypothetical protein
MNIENHIFNPIKQVWLKLEYCFATLKEFYRYPYVLIGEHHDYTTKTTLMYRLRGKRDTYQQTAEEICNTPELISKFHPLDVRIIAYICGVEQSLQIPSEKRRERFSIIINKLFNK